MNSPSDEQSLPIDGMGSQSAGFLEQLFSDFTRNPSSVPEQWRGYFERMKNGSPAATTERVAAVAPSSASSDSGDSGSNAAPYTKGTRRSQEQISRLGWAFRAWGHLAANVDPLGVRGVGESFWSNLHPTHQLNELTLAYHGLDEEELDKDYISIIDEEAGPQKLRDIVARLTSIYCGTIGYEFLHVQDLAIRKWFLDQIEGRATPRELNKARRVRILQQLIRADVFEQFVRKKFPGAKVFSIDGSESLIPLIDMTLERACEQNVDTVVLGMAHRGRLNVLTNIFDRPPCDLFRSFEDRLPQGPTGHGDVRYHLGDNVVWRSSAGKSLDLSMCFNPSHLEYVSAVALGRVRAIQDHDGDVNRGQSFSLLMHGDAAFAGEGIVYETLNLGRLSGYDTGGSVHVIINNQIGFTTTPAEGRSTTYATDVARGIQIPVLHVNGEDLEAVARAVDLAMDFRATFKRDIVIDLVAFRRWGHNETDEPSFTQPRLYSAIDKHGRLRERYADKLIAAGDLTREDVDKLENEMLDYLREQFDRAKDENLECPHSRDGQLRQREPSIYEGGPEPAEDIETGVELGKLQELLAKLTTLPLDFHLHSKLQRNHEDRRKMAAQEETVEWATAEALAIATLAVEGHRVRLTGQDVGRGTFSHRHALLHDVVDGRMFNTFSQLDPAHQAPVEIVNSPLSEAAAMGFEYGYCEESPEALVLWEAQFGDFANVAQVIIDQFLASAEDKWGMLNGLVLLLPHGFEGQGPEHSSARLERFLTLAAEDNFQIAQPSTPAQYYHLLRRQITRRWRKPLVVFNPKSLLRLKQARSPLSEFTTGSFQRVIGDPRVAQASRVILCSGKAYYELNAFREQEGREDVAIVRVEQFYPLPAKYLEEALLDCPDNTPVYWVQEEPENMGAWRYLKARFGARIGRHPLLSVCRLESASPATGSKAIHRSEQQTLIKQAFGERTAKPSLALTSKEITA
jgi:2-oxoglutarate dehydrogenase E1 component